jgi:hypothetical protein
MLCFECGNMISYGFTVKDAPNAFDKLVVCSACYTRVWERRLEKQDEEMREYKANQSFNSYLPGSWMND